MASRSIGLDTQSAEMQALRRKQSGTAVVFGWIVCCALGVSRLHPEWPAAGLA
jgi:hypothetical protein